MNDSKHFDFFLKVEFEGLVIGTQVLSISSVREEFTFFLLTLYGLRHCMHECMQCIYNK